MKIRSDSLFASLGRLGLRDEFFAWYATENPSYSAMRDWLSERNLDASNGALHTLVSYHYSQWRLSKAVEAADAEALALPENIDEQNRARSGRCASTSPCATSPSTRRSP